VLRYLVAYRAGLIRGEEDERFRDVWQAMVANYPDWPGLRSERRSPELREQLEADGSASLAAFKRDDMEMDARPRKRRAEGAVVEPAKIIGLAIFSAILYGIAHDQVTARVCIEYFTVGHPPIFGTDSPTLLAFGWGVVATWWVGLILGIPLAISARVGTRPKLGARDLAPGIVRLLVVMALASLAAGIVGFYVARAGGVILLEPLASRVPRDRHLPFLADLWAHSAAYGVGFLGGLVLYVRTWRRRSRLPSGPKLM
jgi:hypothetical protein